MDIIATITRLLSALEPIVTAFVDMLLWLGQNEEVISAIAGSVVIIGVLFSPTESLLRRIIHRPVRDRNPAGGKGKGAETVRRAAADPAVNAIGTRRLDEIALDPADADGAFEGRSTEETGDLKAKLARLRSLYEEGLIDEAVFREKQAEILKEL